MRAARIGFVIVFVLLATDASLAGKRAKKFWKHMLGFDPAALKSASGSGPGFGLDPIAQSCMDCHDGSRGKRIVIKHPDAPYQIQNRRTVNHPVGMSYDEYAARDPGGYTSRPSLDARVRLVHGEVSCVSCHAQKDDPETSQALPAMFTLEVASGCGSTDRLTLPRQIDLCRACHADK